MSERMVNLRVVRHTPGVRVSDSNGKAEQDATDPSMNASITPQSFILRWTSASNSLPLAATVTPILPGLSPIWV